jgi:hypothetical protein
MSTQLETTTQTCEDTQLYLTRVMSPCERPFIDMKVRTSDSKDTRITITSTDIGQARD